MDNTLERDQFPFGSNSPQLAAGHFIVHPSWRQQEKRTCSKPRKYFAKQSINIILLYFKGQSFFKD